MTRTDATTRHHALAGGRTLPGGAVDRFRSRNGHSVNAYQLLTPEHIAKREFVLSDSYGNHLGKVRREGGKWSVYGVDGTFMYHPSNLQLQGYGAYLGLPGQKRKSHILVGLLGGIGQRAFIPTDAVRNADELLGANPKHGGDDSWSDFDAGMGAKLVGRQPIRRIALGDPSAGDMTHPVGGRYFRSDGKVGSYYGLYAQRDVGHGVPATRAVAINTTAVRGGGVLNAVVPATNSFDVYDETSAPDHNAVDPSNAPRWAYGQVVHDGSRRTSGVSSTSTRRCRRPGERGGGTAQRSRRRARPVSRRAAPPPRIPRSARARPRRRRRGGAPRGRC